MKNEELKKILKPLIKQCIKEVIFEEGVLSGIISEVVGGLTSQEPIVETRQPSRASSSDEIRRTKKKLLESVSKDAYNGVDLFEDTEPLSKGGSISESSAPSSPLSTYAPHDPGVNIDGLFSVAGKNWAKLI
tara:strand:+ start:718 stop:1113 length:396 start_codon:yes stop_codon:yes gene_type:complete